MTYNAQDNRWFARVYGRNLTNKLYIESAQNVDPLWVWAFYGEPRSSAARLVSNSDRSN